MRGMSTIRLTFCLSVAMESALRKAAKKNNRTLSDEIRARLAESLKIKAPAMTRGNPNVAEQAQAAAQARWAKQKNGDGE